MFVICFTRYNLAIVWGQYVLMVEMSSLGSFIDIGHMHCSHCHYFPTINESVAIAVEPVFLENPVLIM